MSSFDVIDPTTEKKTDSFAALDEQALEAALDRSFHRQKGWAAVPIVQRAEVLKGLATELGRQKSDLASLMTREMGKRTEEGESEVEKCAWVCEYYSEKGPDMLNSTPIDSDASKSYIAYQPLGLILAIMPWNFPFWQVFRFLAPALLAGNSALLKHASNVPGCSLAIEALVHRVLRDQGFDPQIFFSLLIEDERAEAVISDRRVRGVTLTGSTRAGRAVAAMAGQGLKKTVLELGGSDPYVVLHDADVERAAEVCVTSRMINGGQSCIAAKRWIVVESVLKEFERRVGERLAALRMGDPGDSDTDLGPMARRDLRDSLHRQVQRSVESGARLVLGGSIPDRPGFFYPATLLSDVRPGMPAFDEELFGPVAALIPAADEQEALTLANTGDYGLGAAIFSRDLERAETLARDHLEAGCCFVNDFVRSDPRLPFGGIKDSGYGRELSTLGLMEWVNPKTVWIR